MVLLHQRLPALGARQLNSIHDELIIETPREAADETKAVVRQAFAEGMGKDVTCVPVVTDISIRESWAKE